MKGSTEIHKCIIEKLNEIWPLHSIVKMCRANCQCGDLQQDLESLHQCPNPEIVVHVHDLILTDRRISAKTVAETLETAKEHVYNL